MILDIAPSELLLVGVVALLVIPPKDLPKAMRFAGQWIGKARGLANQFRSGFDDMIRDAELAEMEKKWRAENERIMREHPPESLPHPDAVPAAEMMPIPDIVAEPVEAVPSPDPASTDGTDQVARPGEPVHDKVVPPA